MIDLKFSDKGEEGAIPVNADTLNKMVKEINADNQKILDLIEKAKYITTDNNGTHFTSGVYANGSELVADNEYPDPSK